MVLAVRQRKIDYRREAKKKIDIAVRRESPSSRMKSILAVRQRKKSIIAVRRELPQGGMKLILAARQRKKSIIAVRRESP